MAVKILSSEIKSHIKAPALQPTANSLDLVFTAPDDTNGVKFLAQGNEIVLAQNTDVGAQTFTVVSVADELNRTGDITAYSMGAGEFAQVPIYPQKGFRDSSGYITITVSNVAVKFMVLRTGAQL